MSAVEEIFLAKVNTMPFIVAPDGMLNPNPLPNSQADTWIFPLTVTKVANAELPSTFVGFVQTYVPPLLMAAVGLLGPWLLIVYGIVTIKVRVKTLHVVTELRLTCNWSPAESAVVHTLTDRFSFFCTDDRVGLSELAKLDVVGNPE